MSTATVWTNGIPLDVGKATSQDNGSQAFDINNLGQVVGADVFRNALLWENGNVFNLNDLVSNVILGNSYLYAATGINNSGWIVGFMYDATKQDIYQFLLTPDAPSAVPLPAAVWLFGSAIGGFGVMRRRKI